MVLLFLHPASCGVESVDMRSLGALQTAAAATVLPWFCMCGTEADFLPAAGLTSSAHTYAALGQSCTRGDEEEVAHWQGALAAPAVPESRLLWGVEPNPSADAPPRNCYHEDIMSGRVHGVRSGYWMAFQGDGARRGEL